MLDRHQEQHAYKNIRKIKVDLKYIVHKLDWLKTVNPIEQLNSLIEVIFVSNISIDAGDSLYDYENERSKGQEASNFGFHCFLRVLSRAVVN